jgi:hypothetical protein
MPHKLPSSFQSLMFFNKGPFFHTAATALLTSLLSKLSMWSGPLHGPDGLIHLSKGDHGDYRKVRQGQNYREVLCGNRIFMSDKLYPLGQAMPKASALGKYQHVVISSSKRSSND